MRCHEALLSSVLTHLCCPALFTSPAASCHCALHAPLLRSGFMHTSSRHALCELSPQWPPQCLYWSRLLVDLLPGELREQSTGLGPASSWTFSCAKQPCTVSGCQSNMHNVKITARLQMLTLHCAACWSDAHGTEQHASYQAHVMPSTWTGKTCDASAPASRCSGSLLRALCSAGPGLWAQ